MGEEIHRRKGHDRAEHDPGNLHLRQMFRLTDESSRSLARKIGHRSADGRAGLLATAAASTATTGSAASAAAGTAILLIELVAAIT